jgi:hypothetical protein
MRKKTYSCKFTYVCRYQCCGSERFFLPEFGLGYGYAEAEAEAAGPSEAGAEDEDGGRQQIFQPRQAILNVNKCNIFLFFGLIFVRYFVL